jgi:hypothetical protein
VRKIKDVLRLKVEVGLGLRQIARSCAIGLGTAHESLQRAEAAKITWPLGPEWDDDRLEAALFGGPPRSRPAVLPMPDFADLRRQRQQHPHVMCVRRGWSLEIPASHGNVTGFSASARRRNSAGPLLAQRAASSITSRSWFVGLAVTFLGRGLTRFAE